MLYGVSSLPWLGFVASPQQLHLAPMSTSGKGIDHLYSMLVFSEELGSPYYY